MDQEGRFLTRALFVFFTAKSRPTKRAELEFILGLYVHGLAWESYEYNLAMGLWHTLWHLYRKLRSLFSEEILTGRENHQNNQDYCTFTMLLNTLNITVLSCLYRRDNLG